jgi:hypothetical protein
MYVHCKTSLLSYVHLYIALHYITLHYITYIHTYIIFISIFFLNQSIEFRMLKISTTRSTAIKIWSNAVEERRCYRATTFLVQNPSRADTIWKFNDIHVMPPWKLIWKPWNSEMSPVSTTLGSLRRLRTIWPSGEAEEPGAETEKVGSWDTKKLWCQPEWDYDHLWPIFGDRGKKLYNHKY